MNLDSWTKTVSGKLLDLDGFPPAQPYQCHDVWLSYLIDVLGGPIGDGHAPGSGYTDQVWHGYPQHRPGLAKVLTRHGSRENPRRGDVVFWTRYGPVGGFPHVAVALEAPAPDGTILCVSQNPGRTTTARLSLSGYLGVLRPIPATKPTPTPMPKPQEEDTTMAIIEYIRGSNPQGAIYAHNRATGKKRIVPTPEWDSLRAVEAATKERIIVSTVKDADLAKIPNA